METMTNNSATRTSNAIASELTSKRRRLAQIEERAKEIDAERAPLRAQIGRAVADSGNSGKLRSHLVGLDLQADDATSARAVLAEDIAGIERELEEQHRLEACAVRDTAFQEAKLARAALDEELRRWWNEVGEPMYERACELVDLAEGADEVVMRLAGEKQEFSGDSRARRECWGPPARYHRGVCFALEQVGAFSCGDRPGYVPRTDFSFLLAMLPPATQITHSIQSGPIVERRSTEGRSAPGDPVAEFVARRQERNNAIPSPLARVR
jgi:hypothetical protein